MKRRLIITLVLLIVLFSGPGKFYGNSQTIPEPGKETKNNHLIFGAGWASLGIRDMGMSPLYYSGSHFYGNAGHLIRRDNYLSALDIRFLYGTIYPGIYPELTSSGMNSLKAGGSYSYLRLTGSFAEGEGKLFTGGTLNSQFGHYKHHRFTNSAINQYFATTLGISGLASYPIELGQKQFLVVFHTHVPLVAATVRQAFAYIKPSGFLDHETGNFQSFFKSIDIHTLNNFFSLETVISIEYRFENDNAWRIGYRWEYFGHYNYNVMKSATHGIFIQTLLNL
jgi:hypothetical protein